jgi:TatD DNase family protein
LIDTIVERGDFVSATPALAYSPPHQAAIRNTPLENILLETDCPVVYQGRSATPSEVMRVCEQVASLKGCSPDEVAGQTTENVKHFLGNRILANPLSE